MWIFSDGTVVHLGGLIEGATIFAQQLREKVQLPFLHPKVRLGLPPAGAVKVNLNDPAMVNAWLEDEVEHRRLIWSRQNDRPLAETKPPIRIIERPENIPPLPFEHAEPSSDPDAIY